MPKIQQLNGRYFITLPKELVDKKGWKKHQSVYFSFNERGNMELVTEVPK